MQRLILALLVFSCLSCTQNQHKPANCSKYKEGVYVMYFRGKTDTLIRSNGFQTEIFNKTELTFDVKWIDSCSYTLTPTEKTVKKYSYIHADNIVSVEILKTTDSSYTQKVTSNVTDQVITGEVHKVKAKSN